MEQWEKELAARVLENAHQRAQNRYRLNRKPKFHRPRRSRDPEAPQTKRRAEYARETGKLA